MADHRRFRTTQRVAAREVESELVLLDLEEGSFFVSRGTGPRIWELLAGGSSVDEIAQLVADRYGLEVAKVTRDVEQFVQVLLEKRFLESAS